MTGRELSIFIVDDDVHAQQRLKGMLSVAGLSSRSFASGEDFLTALDPDQPGCCLLESRLPGMSGLQVLQQLNQHAASLPVIIIGSDVDVATTVAAMKSGALDVLRKPVDADAVLPRVWDALAEDNKRRVKAQQRRQLLSRYDTLSPREREVMNLVVHGRANKEIAAQLSLSPRTVEIHRARVMRKMQAGSLAELVVMAPLCRVA